MFAYIKKNIGTIFLCILVLFASIMLLTGHKSYSVISDSMNPTIKKNALVYVKKDNNPSIENYQLGDIIAVNKNEGIPLMHRIVEIKDDLIITKGDANLDNDEPINIDQVIGKVKLSIPYVGFLFSSQYILFILVGVIAIIIISYYIVLEIRKKE